jgi:hypothetical protein
MRRQREAGVGCMLIIEGRVGYVGLGQVGSMEGLWLGGRSGGEGPGGVFLEKDQREREKGLLQGFL